MSKNFLSPEFDYSEYETLDELISVIEESINGLNFYCVIYDKNMFFSGEETIGTFRNEMALREVYNNKKIDCHITQITFKEIVEDPIEYFPIYCVELHNEYEYLDYLIKDIMISKISGMMNKELCEEK